ncbi:N-ethylmaleimide reductase [Variovorax sp. 54]|uniref:alkene reductase n=1 Tax=Variovorax sp. 54 TaxID=2035212 RepID=UPI000C4D5963|nr:alkene reductase [Variovorax sp. 54]PIF73719.1 N-ethylmaleimide reductase [Variovorax sp. 54]
MTPTIDPLFEPLQLGAIALSNRIVMAPMTRSRAAEGDVPTDLHVAYYRQRATAGLIVTEGVQPSAAGKGYCRTPGLHTPQQVAAWRRVTSAVHAEGGRIVAQLMHAGRIASHHNKQADTVAPSAVRASGKIFTDAVGPAGFDMPRPLRLDEIPGVIREYAQAAVLAREAGFDGVELHGTSGYLPMQFLATNTNLREDAYGGSAENRRRFMVEVLQAMSAAIGADRVGLRIRPASPYNDVTDAAPLETYSGLLDAVSPLKLAYLHIMRSPLPTLDAFAMARRHFAGPLILNDGFDGGDARQALRAGQGEAVSFGRHFIANPDLVRRLRENAALADFDPKTLYTPGTAGYTDYPCLP